MNVKIYRIGDFIFNFVDCCSIKITLNNLVTGILLRALGGLLLETEILCLSRKLL